MTDTELLDGLELLITQPWRLHRQGVPECKIGLVASPRDTGMVFKCGRDKGKTLREAIEQDLLHAGTMLQAEMDAKRASTPTTILAD